jgi:DNA polymerase-3 subunit beta
LTLDILANQVGSASRHRAGEQGHRQQVPDYNRVIPTTTPAHRLQGERSCPALRRGNSLEREIRGMRLVLGNDRSKIICTNSEQEEAEEGSDRHKGDALDVGFNINYL